MAAAHPHQTNPEHEERREPVRGESSTKDEIFPQQDGPETQSSLGTHGTVSILIYIPSKRRKN